MKIMADPHDIYGFTIHLFRLSDFPIVSPCFKPHAKTLFPSLFLIYFNAPLPSSFFFAENVRHCCAQLCLLFKFAMRRHIEHVLYSHFTFILYAHDCSFSLFLINIKILNLFHSLPFFPRVPKKARMHSL